MVSVDVKPHVSFPFSVPDIPLAGTARRQTSQPSDQFSLNCCCRGLVWFRVCLSDQCLEPFVLVSRLSCYRLRVSFNPMNSSPYAEDGGGWGVEDLPHTQSIDCTSPAPPPTPTPTSPNVSAIVGDDIATKTDRVRFLSVYERKGSFDWQRSGRLWQRRNSHPQYGNRLNGNRLNGNRPKGTKPNGC